MHGDQASKVRLKASYSSRGYLPAGEGALEHDHPGLIPLLAVPCVYEIWRKELPEGPPPGASRATARPTTAPATLGPTEDEIPPTAGRAAR